MTSPAQPLQDDADTPRPDSAKGGRGASRRPSTGLVAAVLIAVVVLVSVVVFLLVRTMVGEGAEEAGAALELALSAQMLRVRG